MTDIKVGHTPGPWTSSGYVSAGEGRESIVILGQGYYIARLFTPNGPFGTKSRSPERNVAKVNAAFIVRACNNFDALLEACKTLIVSYEFHCPEAKEYSNAIEKAREAIAQAEGEA